MRYHPFVPHRLERGPFLKWLKRVHAWTGLWGALLFLLLGTSGFLLNHRNLLKIDTSAPVEVTQMDVAIASGEVTSEESLGRWAKAQFAFPVEGRPASPEQAGKATMLGRELPQAEKWVRVFTLTDAKVTVEHLPGASAVSVKREASGLLAVIKNLHKGTGLPVAWVLLLDTIAGALITMSLTGFLLWSRLHGPRLVASLIAGGSLIWAAVAILPALT